jgi:hypothetical protein
MLCRTIDGLRYAQPILRYLVFGSGQVCPSESIVRENDKLPTIGEAISNWLGVQLPAVHLPQTIKNIDKAIGKIVLAGGENLEAHIKANTSKTKAIGKLNVDGLFRTEEEKRKLENRAAAMKAALEDIETNPAAIDSPSEIEDDWLNFFVRCAEDKSSEELQALFGKILSGEIRKPGSFSLRTIQIMSTISKRDAEALSMLLSFAISDDVLPFEESEAGRPTAAERLLLEELGIAGHPSRIGGMVMNYEVQPGQKRLLMASHRGILVENNTQQQLNVQVAGQMLTTPARELAKIANSPPTDFEFLKSLAKKFYLELHDKYAVDADAGLLAVRIVSIQETSDMPTGETLVRYDVIYTHGANGACN